MALEKVTYVDNQTVITAEQMNAIQDAIIANEKKIVVSDVAPEDTSALWVDTGDNAGYVLTDADKQEIAELVAPLVDVPSGGSGSTEEWTLVCNFTTTEEVTELIFNTDANGEPFAFTEMWAIISITPTAADDGTATTDAAFYVIPNSYWATSTTLGRSNLNSGWPHSFHCHMQVREGFFWGDDHAANPTNAYTKIDYVRPDEKLKNIKFVMQNRKIQAGARFLIFGK